MLLSMVVLVLLMSAIIFRSVINKEQVVDEIVSMLVVFLCVTLIVDLIVIISRYIMPDSFLQVGTLADWVSGVGSLLAVMVALFGEKISAYIFRPKIEPKEIFEVNQNKLSTHYRLIIYNLTKHKAKSVVAEIQSITTDGTVKRNFIPDYLGWTHYDEKSRDIYAKQTAYIDVLEFDGNDLKVCAQNLMKRVPDMVKIPEGETRLDINIISENGINRKINVLISKNNGMTNVSLTDA